MKPGYQTTEFWLTLLALLVAALLSSGALPDEHLAMKVAGVAATVLASLGYTAGRSLAKSSSDRAREVSDVVRAKLGPTR